MQLSSPTIIDLLRSTLERLEADKDLDASDPQLQDLKSSILLAIAEMEMKKQDAA